MEILAARNSGLGVFLPPEASEVVNAWRRLYDPSFEFLAPHITLAYPPFVPPQDWKALKPTIEAALAAFTPFPVTLRSTGVFVGESYVLWLKPEDGGILIEMRRALEAALPEYVPALPFAYQPHVSIGFFTDRESLQQAQAQVGSELRASIEFQVTELHYVFQLEENVWTHYDRILI
jgi:2'-5' RNA ligase